MRTTPKNHVIFPAGLCLLLGLTRLAWAGAWAPFVEPPEEETGRFIRDFVIDKTGTLWTMGDRWVHWWDGQRWVKAMDGGRALSARYAFDEHFFGDPDLGVYLSQRPSGKEDHGSLYVLESGVAKKLAELDSFGIYVSRSGDVFNFGADFCAILQDGAWNRVKATLASSSADVSVADFSPKGAVVFICSKTPLATIWTGKRFLTDIPLPAEAPVEGERLFACRWGKDRVLYWYYGREGSKLGAAQLVRGKFRPVDLGQMQEQFRDKNYHIEDGWAGPDGSVWLHGFPSRGEVPPGGLLHLLSEGGFDEVSFPQGRTLGWGHLVMARFPNRVLHAADGTIWLGLVQDGIASIRKGQIHVHDWKERLLPIDFSNIFQHPEGQVYAASASRGIYRWDPDAVPDPSLTEFWEEIPRASWAISAPDKRDKAWLFRPDRPGKISFCDESGWKDLEVPFDGARRGQKIIDDVGRLAVEVYSPRHRPETYVLDPRGGVKQYADFKEALVAMAKAGARRLEFAYDGYTRCILVTDDGQIWYGGSGGIEVYLGGEWKSIRLYPSDVKALGLDDNGRVLALTREELWRCGGGPPVRVAKADKSSWKYFELVGQNRGQELFYFPDLPPSLQRQFTVFFKASPTNWSPVAWAEASQIYELVREAESAPDGKAIPPVSVSLAQVSDGVGIRTPFWSVPAADGGWWIREGNSKVFRWLDDVLVGLDTRDTPLGNRVWNQVLVLPTGQIYICTEFSGGHSPTFLRKAYDATEMPAATLSRSEVQDGRRISMAWDLLPGSARFVICRTLLDGRWRPAPEGVLTYPIVQAGKREVTFEYRAMDSLGVLGPIKTAAVPVDVRLPRTRWTARPPKKLEDILWEPAIVADWTQAEVSRRIEWRAADRAWEEVPRNGRIPVAQFNNRKVRFQFRGVEDGDFVDPEPLSADVAVEIPQEEAFDRRIDHILYGSESQRAQAIEDLTAFPELAQRYLQVRMNRMHETRESLSQVLQKILQRRQ